MNFKENFIHAIWKYQYFDKRDLRTCHGVSLEVKKIGYYNFHEGPDFRESHLSIGQLEHHGNVEVHLKSSDWYQHAHDRDHHYDSVILHVVWEHDTEVKRADGTLIPTLELKGKVFLSVLRNYERLVSARNPILCHEFLPGINEIIKFSALEKALVERLEEKSKLVDQEIISTAGDWEEVAYRWLFYCFGFKVNNVPMLKLAHSVPYKVLKKHSGKRGVLEAVLMGQAGFLTGDQLDEYSAFAQKEHGFYHRKYSLPEPVYPTEWKFMRVRPSNYPPVRIAQLATVLSQSPNLFSLITQEVDSVSALQGIFSGGTSTYWEYHYFPGKECKKHQNRVLSKRTIHLLAINYLVPLWFSYGKYLDDERWRARCFDLLQEIPPEENHIISDFIVEGWRPLNAFDSQGMIGLHHAYCSQKKCLNCKVGQNLLSASD
ncbi:DUF2851 family protein [Echinicola marina]|uniref:DUF2851 family protein n=1 Tax=Echinicola marina TaxID=2859768 RepID=UPI001CF64E96|nr:DUF2851 family protein [Echinicola marina]UCS95160.1 DUF2851 family protein [Echinicola marina]